MKTVFDKILRDKIYSKKLQCIHLGITVKALSQHRGMFSRCIKDPKVENLSFLYVNFFLFILKNKFFLNKIISSFIYILIFYYIYIIEYVLTPFNTYFITMFLNSIINL